MRIKYNLIVKKIEVITSDNNYYFHPGYLNIWNNCVQFHDIQVF